jgi:hypothetical protein
MLAFSKGISFLSCGLAALIVCSLAIEDQRRFLSCRTSGASVDACLLQIHGR